MRHCALFSTLKDSFPFQAKSPDPSQIPDEDLVGVTVVLLTCSYKDREFVRVGYYVNNEYTEEEMKENPPARPVIEKVCSQSKINNPHNNFQ